MTEIRFHDSLFFHKKNSRIDVMTQEFLDFEKEKDKVEFFVAF